jgi:hypothetical protein
MCGNIKGLKITSVFLENEIKNFFYRIKKENQYRIVKNIEMEHKIPPRQRKDIIEKQLKNLESDDIGENNSIDNTKEIEEFKSFKNKEINNFKWLNNLDIILKDVNPDNLFPKNHSMKINYTKEDKIDNTISIENVYGSNQVISQLPLGSYSRKDGAFIPIPSYLDENMDIVESHWIFVKGNWIGNKWVDDWVPNLPLFIKEKGEKNKIYFENGGYWIYDNRKGK